MTEDRATVLVVDDTPENIELLDEILRPHYRVQAALSGEQALALAVADPQPDLILLDVMMPGMDGHDVCRRLKSDPVTASIPVIFVTALDEVDDEKLGLQIGAVDYLTKPVSPPIVEARVRTHIALYDQKRSLESLVFERTRALAESNLRLEQEVEEREKLMARADFLIRYDPLTALPNRRHFMQRLEDAVEKAKRMNHELGLLVVNLDRFHVVLDSMGHASAESLLSIIADRLYQALRPDDLLGRSGYDEFAVLLSGQGATGRMAEFAEEVGERLLREIHQVIRVDTRAVQVTASVGLALLPTDARTALELLRRADVSMLSAKSFGRNRLERYRAQFDSGSRSKFDLEGRLRKALTSGQLRVHYQPVVDLESGAIRSAEALIRLPDLDGVFADTATVVALAQECSLIGALDGYALTAAAAQLKTWQARYGQPGRIAVNVSPQHFQHSKYVELVQQAILVSGIDPTWLEVEITEQALITQWAATIEKLSSLRAMGVTITLDDFGTGYSSLAYLRRLPIDRIKIDQQFVRELGQDKSATAIVEAILLMANAMGYEAVAEGVETPLQRQLLIEGGCQVGQGFLFSAPLPAEGLERLLGQPSLLSAAPDRKTA